jgi:hypothetical protein
MHYKAAGNTPVWNQRGRLSVEACVWVASYALAIVGFIKAAHSEQPLLWLAIWPAPIVLASTIFIFLRQGFHFRGPVLVLGRRPGNRRRVIGDRVAPTATSGPQQRARD